MWVDTSITVLAESFAKQQYQKTNKVGSYYLHRDTDDKLSFATAL
jgi:hypothetical protein